MKYTFETPTIIGALCEDEKEIPSGISRGFKKLEPKIAFLSFEVEGRHLKNTVACMQLMDIAGLFVCGRHRRKIATHLEHLDPAARRTGEVDCVIRRGKKFVGVNVSESIESQKIVTRKGQSNSRKSKTPVKQRLSQKAKMGLFCQTTVEVLTQAFK